MNHSPNQTPRSTESDLDSDPLRLALPKGESRKDWVQENDVQLELLLETELDPVRLVGAAPESVLVNGRLPDRPLVVASEYERLKRHWIQKRGQNDRFVPSLGATEVFPPEDADCIVDKSPRSRR